MQLVHERLARQEAQQYAKRIEQAWKIAHENIKKA
jgi:hypothetical protein